MFGEYNKISSELYNHTKPIGKSLDGDIEYYYEKIKDIKGNILEAGVGTGRILIPYIEKGLKVDGVDISEDMINICKENCKKYNIECDLFVQNLIELNINKKYDAIIMPTGSFCLINNREDMKNVLKNFKEHLNKNGKIILDILFPVDFVENIRKTSIIKINEKTGIVYNYETLNIDWENQITHSINRYEKWVDDIFVGEELSEFNISWYGKKEFIYTLNEIGFKNISYQWDYGKDSNKSILTFEVYV